MHGLTVRFVAGLLVVGGALGLCACGGGTAHVVGPAPSRVSTGSSAVSGTSASSSSSAPATRMTTEAGASASSDLAAATPLLSGDLRQLDAELSALDGSLGQANSDLTDPQPDS